MKYKLSNFKKLTIFIASASLFFSSPILAQEDSTSTNSVGLEISSPIYEFSIDPGQVQQEIIKIKNVGSSEQTYYPEVLDFTSDNQSGTPIFLDEGEESGTYSLAKWVSISTEPITVSPNQSVALNFNITVPSNAEPGGHYAGILFGTRPPEPTSGNQVGLASKVGSLILVRVSGDVKESAKITDFKTDKGSYSKADVKFTTAIENTGNVHVQPKGVITIKNFLGGTAGTVDVNNLSANVLPGSSRIFEGSWKDEGFKVGLYTATVTLNYGNPSQIITAQTTFWILPWTEILVTLAIIILAILLLVLLIKQYNRWIISKANKQSEVK